MAFSVLPSLRAAALICAALAAPAAAQHRIGTVQQPIRGGEVITGYPGIVEFTVARPDLGAGRTTGCTGTMIAPDTVLTAAHCFDRNDGMGGQANAIGTRQANIFYHDPDGGRRSVFSGTATWFVPPQYNGLNQAGPGDANADIGVLQIPGRFTATDYRVYLRIYVGTNDALDTRLRAYGAGLFSYSGNTDTRLRTHWFEVESVARNHIVVDNRAKVSTCRGDSGGPLVFVATSPEGPVPTAVAVLSQMETDTDNEGPNCTNNDPPFDDSFYSRTNWRKLSPVLRAAGMECSLHRGASQRYRRCFGIPFINDAPVEGLTRRRAVAVAVGAIF